MKYLLLVFAAQFLTIASDSDPCYLEAAGICFKYYSIARDYREAKAVCKSIGGKLSEPRSEAIKNPLTASVIVKHKKIWIGATDFKQEGSFVWDSDGMSVAVPNSWWAAGEPNNWRGGEHCLTMRHDGKLNDVSCTQKFEFFCEKTL